MLTVSRKSRLFFVLCASIALLAATSWCLERATAAPDGGTVGTGTPVSCTEAALNSKMAGGGAVNFNCGPNPHTITLTSFINVTSSTTVNGGGKITLSGGHTNKIIFVSSGGLTLTNITLADGKSSFGGCLAALASVNMVQATLRNCHSPAGGFFGGHGGALAMIAGNLSLSNTQILSSVAELNGGGIYLNGGAHLLDHVTISGNHANVTNTNGGGIAIENSALLTLLNSQVRDNTIGKDGHGAGIAIMTSTLQAVNLAVLNNHGTGSSFAQGAGLYLLNSTANLQTVDLIGNDGVYSGGGIHSDTSNLTIADATVNNNTGFAYGSGIYAANSSLDVSNTFVDANGYTSGGGGLYLYGTTASLSNMVISNNRSRDLGGGLAHYQNTVRLVDVTLSGNSVDGTSWQGGGAIWSENGLLLVSNSTLHNNWAALQGGGLDLETSRAILTNTTISANQAITGGGVYLRPDYSILITLTNVTLKDNMATMGGGIYNGNGPNIFLFLKNTIIADSPHGGNCRGKAVAGSKYSLSTDLSCALGGTGDQNNTPAQLFPLADNGGPTRTFLPSPSSPAVNSVMGADCPLTDQRGVLRPQAGNCDRGSVERAAADPLLAPRLYLPLILR